VADTLDVSRSNLVERSKGRSKPRGRYNKAEDDELLSIIRRLVDQRSTYGYRRIAALLNRERQAADLSIVNANRVQRIMGNHAMLLGKRGAQSHHFGDWHPISLRSKKVAKVLPDGF